MADHDQDQPAAADAPTAGAPAADAPAADPPGHDNNAEDPQANLAATLDRLHQTEVERDRLKRQTERFGALVVEREQLTGRLERLERALIGERERNATLRFQRDRYRHQAASQRTRRFWRLGAALAEARRAPAKLLRLPVTIARIILGPPAAPDVPPPIPAGEGKGESTDVTAAQLQSPTEIRPTIHLETRYLLPPRPRSVTNLKVAAVVDTFTEASFAPDCNLLTFRPDTWRAALETEPPHLLFVESAWKGNGGSWEFQVGSYAYPQSVGLPQLNELVGWCRDNDIPTVFWNKEDPVHFDKFKEAARLFDVVLTTDADRIPAYEALDDRRAEVIAALPFAAQPVLHHPTRSLDERDPRPVFGGTYYKNRHPERREQMERLLDAARPFDLIIYDRTHGQESESVGFPDRFLPHVEGGVPYEEMVRIYRDHRLFLNTNSVIASPTMFSRRVFELLACGTPVVSTPSLGVEQMFGDIVPIVETAEAADAAMRELLTDDDAWQWRSTAGIRAVLGEHTYQHRLTRIASLCGYATTPYAERQATILLLDDDQDRAHGLCAELVTMGGRLSIAVGTPTPARFGDLPVATIRQDADTSTSTDESARWQHLADRVDSPFVILADPLATPEAIVDLVHSLVLTDAAAVGFAVGGPAWRHVPEVLTAPIALRRDHVVEHGWDTSMSLTGAQMERLAAAGILPYSLGDPAGRVPAREAAS